MLGAVEGEALLLEPLHAEDAPQAHEVPVLAALLADHRRHARVPLQKDVRQLWDLRTFTAEEASYLEVTRTLNGEDEDHGVVLHEGPGELGLVTGRGGPDPLLLGDLDAPHVAALHDEVARGRGARGGGRLWEELWEVRVGLGRSLRSEIRAFTDLVQGLGDLFSAPRLQRELA